MSRASPRLVSWPLVLVASMFGCRSPEESSSNPGASVDGSAAPDGPVRAADAPVLGLPDASNATPPPPPGPQVCARDVHRAEKTPVDLVLVVDASDSMDQLS